jgi:hypothetical protein
MPPSLYSMRDSYIDIKTDSRPEIRINTQKGDNRREDKGKSKKHEG